MIANFCYIKPLTRHDIYDGIQLGKNYDIPLKEGGSKHTFIKITAIYKESTMSSVKCKYTLYDRGRRYAYVGGYEKYYDYLDEFDCDDSLEYIKKIVLK